MATRRKPKGTKGGGWAVTPINRKDRPAVMDLSDHEARRSASDRNRRPSTGRGLGGRRYVVVKNETVEHALPTTKAGKPSLTIAKRRERRERAVSRESSRRYRARRR
jgi:hypothetical protein